MNTKHLFYPLALPRKATRKALHLCRDTTPKGCPTARNHIQCWDTRLHFFLLYPFTSTLKTSFINQSDTKDEIVYWDTHASFLGTRPWRLWFWLGGTHTQKGCGREITFHLFRHLLNSTRQECEDRARSPEPLVSHRSLQNAAALWASAENCQVLEVIQQPSQGILGISTFQTFSEQEDYKVGRYIFVQAKYYLSPPWLVLFFTKMQCTMRISLLMRSCHQLCKIISNIKLIAVACIILP